MTHNSQITITGFVAGEPQFFPENDGKTAFLSARIGSTPRKYDRQNNDWIDGETTWFDLNAYGALAKNLEVSIEKGTPLFISGNLTSRVWTDDEGKEHTVNVIKATAVGHNLTFGTATFKRGTASDDELAQVVEIANDPAITEQGKKKK